MAGTTLATTMLGGVLAMLTAQVGLTSARPTLSGLRRNAPVIPGEDRQKPVESWTWSAQPPPH
jgi:hypothetical protein